jgi:hypothetical protein
MMLRCIALWYDEMHTDDLGSCTCFKPGLVTMELIRRGPTAVASGYRSFVAAMSRPGSPRLRPMRLGDTDIMDHEGEYPVCIYIASLLTTRRMPDIPQES